MENKGAIPLGTSPQVSDTGRTFSYLPSLAHPGPARHGASASHSTDAPPKEAASNNRRSQRSDEGINGLPEISDSKGSVPVGKATYKLHLASSKIAREMRKEIDKLIPEKEGTMEIGLLTRDGISIVRGDEKRHKPLVDFAKALISRASPEILGFKLTALAVAKGWPRIRTITNSEKTAAYMPGHSEPIGDRLFFPWAEKASVMAKMDENSKFNIHGKLMRWNGTADIKVDSGDGDVYSIYLYNVRNPSEEETWEEEALEEMGFPLATHDDTISTTSEESGVDETDDVTANLEPILMTKK